jgi:hypothetical protein
VETGKLYRSSDGKFLTNVNYQFQQADDHNWWGELLLVDYVRIDESGRYILELEDKRKGKCVLKKRVNRAVQSLPPRYIYRFSGNDPLK